MITWSLLMLLAAHPIYGGSTPSFPYSIPWASSLFEDNAEYGYGILNGINMKRDKIKKYMKEYPRNKVFKKLA